MRQGLAELRAAAISVAMAAAVAMAVPVSLAPHPAQAQSGPFDPGWRLDGTGSALRFTSVKNGAVVETSAFATLAGEIAPTGAAEIRVLLDSVDTGIDLRNVRMRFLFFETFTTPEATISLALDEALVADLEQVRRKTLVLPYRIALHGVTQNLAAPVTVTLLDGDTVSVTSATPVILETADFGFEPGLAKLEEAAGVVIVPAAMVTFDFLFRRIGTGAEAQAGADTGTGAAAGPVPPEMASATAPSSAALETKGDFSVAECTGRFEILSRTGNIYFRSASARLDAASRPVLDAIADIIRRCPGLTVQVSGHTDSDGSEDTNQRLSEARARAVTEYLSGAGIAPARLVATGYGEARPIVPNTSAGNMARNRRIEFSSVD